MAKIAQIQPNGTVQLQSGLFHKFHITLDDQRSGEVLAKSPDRWKVGDDVEAEVNQTQYGTKLKLSKPDQGGFNKGSYGGGMSPDKERRITFLSCLNSAASFYGQRTAEPELVVATALQWTEAAFNLNTNEVSQQAKTPAQPPF